MFSTEARHLNHLNEKTEHVDTVPTEPMEGGVDVFRKPAKRTKRYRVNDCRVELLELSRTVDRLFVDVEKLKGRLVSIEQYLSKPSDQYLGRTPNFR